MILHPTRGWLLFDENYLLLDCNYLSDYLQKKTFLSKHLSAERLKTTFNFQACRNLSFCWCQLPFVMRCTVNPRLWLPLLPCLLSPRCVNKCTMLCTIWRPLFWLVLNMTEAPFSFMFSVLCLAVCSAAVTLWILLLGIENFPINPFLCFSRILRCICGSGWHREKWTPAVWYLEPVSECIMKLFLGITVIAHQGTLSLHYIEQSDRAILSGHF